jgi:hypothetical protein
MLCEFTLLTNQDEGNTCKYCKALQVVAWHVGVIMSCKQGGGRGRDKVLSRYQQAVWKWLLELHASLL